MQSVNKTLTGNGIPWFKSWFDTVYYQKLYRNHDEREAQTFIDNLLEELHPVRGSSMLDVGCGSGRHSRYLAAKGFNITGLDLSPSSIREAKKGETGSLCFRQHDMRLPFGCNQFDYVFNFFTSFGYFKTWKENNLVVRNMSRALRKRGMLLIDYMNACYAEQHLIPEETKEIDGVVYHIKRWADDAFIYKRISTDDRWLNKPVVYTEQVARFDPDDFNELFACNQLQPVKTFGSYHLDDYDKKTSQRLIILARKRED